MRPIVRPGCEIGCERTARFVPRHHHPAPYAAIVLEGGYVEAGDSGRFSAGPGDVLLHGPLEAHMDQFGRGGARILNLPLSFTPTRAFGRVRDPDAIARSLESDLRAGLALLEAQLEPADRPLADWPDLLALDLAADRVGSLGGWARAMGLRPSSVSRGFRCCYGVSPQRFRLEQRARRAMLAARDRAENLARLAAEAGFADQAHLSRTTRKLYGLSPSQMRGDGDNCVQDGRTAAP